MRARMLGLLALAIVPMSTCAGAQGDARMCDGKTPDQWRAAGRHVIVGTNADNSLKGTAGDDVIFGLEGRDTINGGGGNDILCGHQGRDTLVGAKGNDRLFGGLGGDGLKGGGGSDFIDGQEDENFVSYENALNGVLIQYHDGSGTAKINGTNATDQLRSITGFTGTQYDDRINTRDVTHESIWALGGDDTMRVDGRDGVDGGTGNDTCFYQITIPHLESCNGSKESTTNPSF